MADARRRLCAYYLSPLHRYSKLPAYDTVGSSTGYYVEYTLVLGTEYERRVELSTPWGGVGRYVSLNMRFRDANA
jgi:hypothetical protein